ncbi:MAG: hypothetical protein LBR51_04415 [Bacteroidales bacterium]|jgi:hypothetical protein|nr:hypothetical protein [Bacteroidales bacterium]
MKKVLLFLVMFLAISLSVFAQNDGYYWYKGEKISLVPSESTVNVITTAEFQTIQLTTLGFEVISEVVDQSALQTRKIVKTVLPFINKKILKQ